MIEIHFLLEFSWDKLRTVICSLRTLVDKEELEAEPIKNMWIVANDPTVFPVQFESMVWDLTCGSLRVIRQMLRGEVDKNIM